MTPMIATRVSNQVAYFKRYRMEMDLLGPLPPVSLPAGYTWIPWGEELLEIHAEVKYHCFKSELDGIVFPNLSNRLGCQRLMREIRDRPGFYPASTWLLASNGQYVGTVQGVATPPVSSLGKAGRSGVGGIQNLGIIPSHRGKRLGVALLLQALHAFQRAGLECATLEVTARNETAVRLYRQTGFRFRKTLYRAVEPQTYQLEPCGEPEWVV